MDNLYLGLLLFVVVFITCYETYSQEAMYVILMEQFRAMVPAQASVIREGNMRPINTSDLVLGDIIRYVVYTAYVLPSYKARIESLPNLFVVR